MPAAVEIARRRAAAEDLTVDFVEADAENLPFADDSFDYVLSAIGVMFTADHARAAGRAGPGRAAPADASAWRAGRRPGFIGQLLKTVGRHVPPPPVAQSPTRWGAEEACASCSVTDVADVSFATRVGDPAVRLAGGLRRPLPDLLRTHPQGGRAARPRTAAEALRDDMVALAAAANRATDGTFVSDWEYLVGAATKR